MICSHLLVVEVPDSLGDRRRRLELRHLFSFSGASGARLGLANPHWPHDRDVLPITTP
jgi:hypothetical protein